MVIKFCQKGLSRVVMDGAGNGGYQSMHKTNLKHTRSMLQVCLKNASSCYSYQPLTKALFVWCQVRPNSGSFSFAGSW